MDLNKKHLLYLTVFFLFLSLNASGQSNSISGRVLNQNTKESVEYASVVLFKQDSVFLNGTTAEDLYLQTSLPMITYCRYLVWALKLKKSCYKTFQNRQK